MKINNIAVAGVLVAIFGLIDSAHATDDTIIASKAYVDAKVGDTSAAVTDGTNALTLENSSTSAPSITAVKGMTVTSITADPLSASNTKVPTEKAVSTAIESVTDNALNAATGKLVKTNAIQNSVLYVANTASGNSHSSNKAISTVTANANVFSTNTVVKADADSYVPTVASVEARIKGAVATAVADAANTSALSLTNASTTSDKAPSLRTVYNMVRTDAIRDTTNATDTVVPSEKAVATALAGKVTTNDAITAKNNSIVNYDAKGLVTGGVVFEDATGGLTGVNGEAAGSNGCSTTKPCVLTYLGGTGTNAKYRWSPMDPDGALAE